jgi:Protein of unknown function (DUF2997)
MTKKVHIIINPKTGQVEFEVEGVMGGACTDITSALTKGHLVQEEKLTEDYFVPSEEPAYVGD